MASAPQKQQEENKQVIRQFFELLDRHDTERMGQLLISSSNYSFHPSGLPSMDWNAHKQLLDIVTRAFPDLCHNIIDLVAEGNKVAVRMNVTGTHKGEFQGIPPSGRSVSLDEMAFVTIMDGKITEGRIISDTMSFMQQIGAVPTDAYADNSLRDSRGNSLRDSRGNSLRDSRGINTNS